MVVRKISELYDMRTSVGAMGIVGIHTPSSIQIKRRWCGEFFTYRYYRVLGCNVSVACSAQLPADPLQIGTEAGKIAPQDMMNPILYRAMSNDSWNVALNRLYAAASQGDFDQNSVRVFLNAFSNLSATQHEKAYYAMLSSDEWKKALPQQGLVMRRLKPFVYSVNSVMGTGVMIDQPSQAPPGGSLGSVTAGGEYGTVVSSSGNPNADRIVRGPAKLMPRFPTNIGNIAYSQDTSTPYTQPYEVPRTYVAGILLPPASREGSQFYYRMKIDWYVEFTEPVSLLDRLNGPDSAVDGFYTYLRGYSTEASSSKLEAVPLQENTTPDDGSVDYLGIEEPNLIIEK